jgi:phosphate transport system substrate-binding protein
MKVFFLLALSLLSVSLPAEAEPQRSLDALPDFVPSVAVMGKIKIWGSPADGPLIAAWDVGFHKLNPEAYVVASLHGPDSTLAGVYTGVADLAFMAREMREPVEQMAFTWVFRYQPFSVVVANGGINTDRLCANLAIFVHKDNPIKSMSLSQLDAIFGAEHRRGSGNIRRWGELGLEGSWTSRQVHVYGPLVSSIEALHFRKVVLQDSRKWNPDYWEIRGPGGDILDLLAKDPDGITFAPLKAANKSVKAIALSGRDEGPFAELTEDTVSSQAYPLTRSVTMVLNRAPGAPVEPRIKEFLRFILSRQGQEIIAKEGGYIPLNAAMRQKQLRLLD